MSFPIGFAVKNESQKDAIVSAAVSSQTEQPVKSLVQIHFPDRNMTLSYFNDRFDLHRGDIVYVDGKLQGLRGRVVSVNYNFKIKLSDYKKVIGKADTNIKGKLQMAGSHFVTCDPAVLPFEKIITWFKAPEDPEVEYVTGSGGDDFLLSDLSGMKVSPEIADRGENYYLENRVVYLCIDGIRGRAIVEGREPYLVEFTFQDGRISSLVCSCFCGNTCKHEVAVMLQLRETLEIIEKNCAAEYKRTGYFAAVSKGALFSFVIDGKQAGSFTL